MRTPWLMLLLLACQAPRVVRRPVAVDLPLVESVEVLLDVPDIGPIGVTLRLPTRVLARAPRELQLRLLGDKTGYAASLIRPPFAPVPVTGTESLELKYSVDLPLLAVPTEEVLFGSFQSLRGKHLALRSLLPLLEWLPQTEAVVVRVKAEAPVASSLPGANGVFVTRDALQLYGGLVLVGPLNEAVGSNALRIVSFEFGPDALDRAAALESRAASRIESMCGARQDLSMVVLYQEPRGSDQTLGGINNRAVAVVLQRDAPDGRASSADGNTLLHELVHSSLATDRLMPHWVTEGFTEYYARRLSLALDDYDEAALRQSLEDAWTSFVMAAPDGRANGGLSDYFGGATLAYCVDARLRKDGSSLDKVLQHARARAHGNLGVGPWEEELALASAPAGALVYSAKKNEPLISYETCLADQGFRVQPARAFDLYDVVALLRAEFQAQGGGRESVVHVTRTLGGSPFQVGDTILSIGGERLITAARLGEVLANVKGTAATVEVLRRGKVVSVQVSLDTTRRASTVGSRRAVVQ